MKSSNTNFQPAKVIFITYAILMLAGAILLKLPQASKDGISFIDAFFTSSSALCVTGLIVKNTALDFTLFGQSVIMVLIQIGGLGYMILAFITLMFVRKRISISESLVLKDILNITSLDNLVKLVKRIFLVVAIVELIGALALFLTFYPMYSFKKAIYSAIFHSVSAFNNAGFSLFSDSLNGFCGNIFLNIVVIILIIAGGTGFLVFIDLGKFFLKREKKLMMHTRIVLISSLILTVAGAILFFLMERNFLFAEGFSLKETFLASVFGSVTARTAGFNTVSYNLLQNSTLFMTMILMFIGASPGGTGGGVKTTTIAVIFLYIRSTIKGHKDTYAYNRRISMDIIAKAFLIVFLAILMVIVATLIIIDIENSDFISTLFEVVSAMGTVGLSVGNGGDLSLAASFSDLSKLLIIFVMFAGRLGPFSFFISVFKKEEEKIRYPEGRLMIG